jgi:hypothetical protein
LITKGRYYNDKTSLSLLNPAKIGPMKPKTRMWLQFATLGSLIAVLFAIGLMPIHTSAVRIDPPPGQSTQQIGTLAAFVSLGIIALIVIAILAALIWVVRRIVRRYKESH